MFEGHAPVAERDNAEPDEPPVRAPILPTQEVLVPSEPACSFPRASSNVFDRFRDFSVEIRKIALFIYQKQKYIFRKNTKIMNGLLKIFR